MTNYLFEANSFSEYIDFIKNYYKETDQEIWYRGQRNHTWEIEPNLYREKKMDIKSGDELSILKYKFADFKEVFFKLKEEIIERNLFNILGLNNFNIMFIAQHYGLLTPVLDWTNDPLIALFFAIDEYEYEDGVYPVVYIFKPGLCNENSFLVFKDGTNIKDSLCIDNMINKFFEGWICDLNNTVANHVPIAIFTEKNFSHRISKQSGKFTFHGAVGPLSYSWNDTTISGKKFVEAIKINPDMVEDSKEYLRVLNITKESVYIDSSNLDEICKELKDESLEKFRESIRESNKKLKGLEK